MNIINFCNGLANVLDKDINDKDRIVACKKAKAAIINFFEDNKKKIQNANNKSFGTSTDIARVNTEAYDFISDVAEYDNGWELAFKKVPLTGDQDSWEIHTGSSGLALQLRQEGERLDINSIKTEKATAYVYKYGLAIGITDEMIRFRKVAKMLDLLEEAKNAYLIGKSEIFYSLLATAAANNVTNYQGTSGDVEARRDILTINTALNALGSRLKTKVANASNGEVLLYANPVDEPRIEAVYNAKTADLVRALGKGADVSSRPVKRIYSYFVSAGNPMLIWQQRKIQFAEVLPLTQLTQQDVLNFSFIQAYWTYLGGIVADTDQCQQFILG